MSRSEWADPKALRDESSTSQNQFSSASEGALRPTQLADFTGQVRVQSQLALLIKAAKARGTSADHVLLSGPPGLGKTTLAMIMAAEMSAPIRISSGPAITHAGDLAAILSSLTDGEILFIDEIHRLARPAEEMLYLAMEDFRVDIVVGKGAGATSIPLELPRFTLIGATTRAGLLPSPLRDRFGFTAQLDYYEDAELAQILARSAGLLQIQMSPEALALVASRSRGTPRIGNRLLRRVRDYAEIHHEASAIDLVQAQAALELYEVDELGLDRLDRAYLSALIEKFGGGPVGLGTMAMALSEEAETVESVCEPYLIRLGFIARTPRGRAATQLAYQHLGIATPIGLSPSLFDRSDQDA